MTALRRGVPEDAAGPSENPLDRAIVPRAGTVSPVRADSNDPRFGNAVRAGATEGPSALSNPDALMTGFGGGIGDGLVASGMTFAGTMTATRGTSANGGLRNSIAGSVVGSASVFTAGSGWNWRGRRTCIFRGAPGIRLAGAIKVKCPGTAGNLDSGENRIAKTRRTTNP
jgi:hypothetical protein